MSNHFISAVAAQQALPFPSDHTGRAVFNAIALAHRGANKPLTVTEVMKLKDLGSPATIHRKVMELRKAGFVFPMTKGNNCRTKYLEVAMLGDTYIDSFTELFGATLPKKGSK